VRGSRDLGGRSVQLAPGEIFFFYALTHKARSGRERRRSGRNDETLTRDSGMSDGRDVAGWDALVSSESEVVVEV